MTKFVGLPPERVDQAVEEFRQAELADLEGQDGFEGVMVLVDRAAGTAAALSLWASEPHMRASESVANGARQSAMAMAKPHRLPVIDHYEVVLAG